MTGGLRIGDWMHSVLISAGSKLAVLKYLERLAGSANQELVAKLKRAIEVVSATEPRHA